jgi:hypothetical protein
MPMRDIALKNRFGKFCADERDGLKCNRGHTGTWERFQFDVLPGQVQQENWHDWTHRGTVTLKGGQYGKYCADEDGRVVCNRDHVHGWEKFNLYSNGDKYAFRGGREGKWCADEGHRIVCNRDHIGSWERFDLHHP